MQLFKVRASGGHSIAAGIIGLTGNQSDELDRLNVKDTTEKGLTDLQYDKQQDLILKRDKRELPQGAKTYVNMRIKEHLYQRKQKFTSKTTEKGLVVEQDGLDFISEQLNLSTLVKNEKEHNNKWFTGTHDTMTKNCIIDVKCSWDCFTFPLFSEEVPEEHYYDQGQVYMALHGVDHYKLIYCLMNTPEHIIMREAVWQSRNEGWDEVNKKIYDQIKADHTYDDIPDEYRIKVFDFDRDDKRIEHLKERVIMCRDYIETLRKANFNIKPIK